MYQRYFFEFPKAKPMIKKILKPFVFCAIICTSCASFVYLNFANISDVNANVELMIEEAIPSDQPVVEIPVASIAEKLALVAKHFLFPTD